MSNLVNGLHAFVGNKVKALEVFHPQLAPRMTLQVEQWRRQIPDIAWNVDKVLEKDGKTAFRYTATGTQNGVKVSWHGSGVATLVDGKIASLHVVEDWWGRLIDAGVIPATPEDNITGRWHGTLFDIAFVAHFNQPTGQHKVTGTLNVPGFPEQSFSGTNAGGTVNLSGAGPAGGTVNFVGHFQDGKIKATLNGGGFNNQAVTLNKG